MNTLNEWIIWHVSFITIKLLKRKYYCMNVEDRMLEPEIVDKETSTENVNIVEGSKDLNWHSGNGDGIAGINAGSN